MIQAFGLTSNPRNELPPALDDVSFEARAGRVTVLLGAPGAGKTTALRLMLELQQGRGVTYFRGRPLHRIAHPSREVGVLLGDVPGHPARTVRGHLRMLCAAAGVPARRADEVLEVVGLVSLREERLGTLSRGMDRRLGLACALLADPHTLVLDDPAEGLSERESRWLHGMLRAHAAQGGTVLSTTADSKEATRIADRVVTLDQGRLVADQEARDFARTRLRPRVAVRSPHAARLAALLAKEARTGRRSVEVVQEGGNRLSVYGSTCADVGETAFRHGILVHQLADEIGDMGPGAAEERPEVREGDRPLGEVEPAPAVGPARASDGGRRPSPVPHQPVSRTTARGTRAPRRKARSGPSAPAAEAATPGTPDAGPVPVPTGARASATGPRPATDGAPAAVTGEAPSTVPDGVPAAVTGNAPSAVPGETPPASRNGQSPLADEARAASAGEASPTPTPTGQARPTAATGEAPPSPTQEEAPSSSIDATPPSPTGEAPPRATGTPPTVVARTQAPVASAELAVPAAEPPTVSAQAPATSAEPAAPAADGSPSPVDAVPTRVTRPSAGGPDRPAPSRPLASLPALPPPISVRPAPSPLRPLRYEVRRASGISTGFLTTAAVLIVSAATALLLARIGHTPHPRLLAAWPAQLPLPPAALGAGLVGALAFGDEFRHPALAADRGTVPRRLGLLTAKLLVTALTALMMAFLTVGCDAEVLYLVHGREFAKVPADWPALSASWVALVVGCAWAGVLAAGVFRSTTAGLAAVLAVPVVGVPLVQKAMEGASVRTAAGFSVRAREVFLLQWPFGGERYLTAAGRVVGQPVGGALALALAALLCAYVLTTLRSRVR
ncbi:ATP-binding cassette domain-containing protein [Streptomyces sp. NPDC059894]|uniref:ABC transporter ATP-binding protein n=1 Tax=unclassified Streptomyces TaxID=2593676 RepID=UPI00364FCC3F